MIDHLKTDLVIRAATMSRGEILGAMGYRKPSPASYDRLQSVLESPELGLELGGFDFRYTSEGFLQALCAAVGMDMDFANRQIKRMKNRLEEERAAFKPFLWVDTGFKRRNQPIFALAALEHERYVQFPIGFWRHSTEKQLSLAQCRVREHIYETGGDLGIWGVIQQYWFYYKNDAAYLLARNGEVLGMHEGPVLNRASSGGEIELITSSDR